MRSYSLKLKLFGDGKNLTVFLPWTPIQDHYNLMMEDKETT